MPRSPERVRWRVSPFGVHTADVGVVHIVVRCVGHGAQWTWSVRMPSMIGEWYPAHEPATEALAKRAAVALARRLAGRA